MYGKYEWEYNTSLGKYTGRNQSSSRIGKLKNE